MTFGQQVLSTLCGTIAGFLFAIALFYITEKSKTKRAKKHLIKNLKREFEYNTSLLQDWINEIDSVLGKITTRDTIVFAYFKYSFYQRFFIQESFRFGIVYDILTNDDVSNLNTILLHCDVGVESYVNDLVKRWREKRIEQQEAFRGFDFEKKALQKFKKQLEEISGKFIK